YDHIEEMLLPTDTNYIFIPSNNENFISSITAKLNGLRSTFNIVVIGLPQWKDSHTLRLDYLANLKCHISSTFWYDKNDAAIALFRNAYDAKYHSPASDYSIQGYNQAF